MKYIVLGKTGYIGEAFVNYFNTISQPYVALSRADINYTNVSVFKDYLESIRDDDVAVINCPVVWEDACINSAPIRA